MRGPSENELNFVNRVVSALQREAIDLTIVGYNVGFDKEFLRMRHDYFKTVSFIDLLNYVIEVTGRKMRLKDIVKAIYKYDANDVDGRDIPELWRRGETKPIIEHLEQDIKRTWLLAQFFRSNFLDY